MITRSSLRIRENLRLAKGRDAAIFQTLDVFGTSEGGASALRFIEDAGVASGKSWTIGLAVSARQACYRRRFLYLVLLATAPRSVAASSLPTLTRCSGSPQRVSTMLRCVKDPEERSASFMDEQQQQRINRAAEEFVNAMVESQRTMAERGVSVQEMNAQLTQQFFNNVINNLQRMTEETQGASQELAEQTQRAQEAAQTLAQESTGAYMAFMNSMLTMSQGAVQRGA